MENNKVFILVVDKLLHTAHSSMERAVAEAESQLRSFMLINKIKSDFAQFGLWSEFECTISSPVIKDNIREFKVNGLELKIVTMIVN